MPTVKATPPPGALTRQEARDRGLSEFLSMSICRRAGCDTFVREARNPWRCVACRDRDAPKEAAKALQAKERASAKAAKERKRNAKAQAEQQVRDLKEAAKAGARRVRLEAKAQERRKAAAAKGNATRAANKARAQALAAAQEGTQEAAGAPISVALLVPPWEDLSEALEADPLVSDAGTLQEADEWANEAALPW